MGLAATPALHSARLSPLHLETLLQPEGLVHLGHLMMVSPVPALVAGLSLSWGWWQSRGAVTWWLLSPWWWPALPTDCLQAAEGQPPALFASHQKLLLGLIGIWRGCGCSVWPRDLAKRWLVKLNFTEVLPDLSGRRLPLFSVCKPLTPLPLCLQTTPCFFGAKPTAKFGARPRVPQGCSPQPGGPFGARRPAPRSAGARWQPTKGTLQALCATIPERVKWPSANLAFQAGKK